MKILRDCQQEEIWDHWKNTETFDEGRTWYDQRYYAPIIQCLPRDARWFLTEIEGKDLAKIFIISSSEWINVTKGKFKLVDAIKELFSNVEKMNNHDDEERKLLKSILAIKKCYQANIDCFDRRFIFVSPSIDGNYTIIEGNKRAVALFSIGRLVGNSAYLGISDGITNYDFARCACL